MRIDTTSSKGARLSADPSVTVAVLTFRRPQLLAQTLPLLLEQAASVRPAATVLVVDNDPDAGAAGLVAQWGDHRLRYVHEPRPGIAAARNRALDETGSDALVFIDDDEQPDPGWLPSLVACWRASGADAVTGPVESVFDRTPDPWVVASERFARRRLPTGTPLRSAHSNNLLLDLRAVRRLGMRFDPRFGLSGGEDTMFTHDLVGRGGSIVWCDEAVVRESVPVQRATRAWVLRREFRTGTTWSRMRVGLTSPTRRPLVRLDLTARALLWMAVALLRVGLGVLTADLHRRAHGQARLAANAGMLAGAVGLRYREYRRPSASRGTSDPSGR